MVTVSMPTGALVSCPAWVLSPTARDRSSRHAFAQPGEVQEHAVIAHLDKFVPAPSEDERLDLYA